jgi:hypothetical protein
MAKIALHQRSDFFLRGPYRDISKTSEELVSEELVDTVAYRLNIKILQYLAETSNR